MLLTLLGLAGGLYLLYFVAQGWLVLQFPYPLDYGEGPLLAQIAELHAGTPIWQLYRDPTAAPYLVINYPPVYLLASAALGRLTGDLLLAGRLVSLAATLGCVATLALLARPPAAGHRSTALAAGLALLFLTIPVVGEWAILLRVDMLGISLGLGGLLALRAAVNARRSAAGYAALSAMLFLLALYTKPSLIAAPAAGLAWLVFVALRPTRNTPTRAATLRLAVATFGGLLLAGMLLFGLFEWASRGWFALHVVTANANRWELDLAREFWVAQARLRWPLAVAALGAAGVAVVAVPQRRHFLALPLLYTAAGALTAAGVGKVGAYSNYFLELYAGLVWLGAAALATLSAQPPERRQPPVLVALIATPLLLLASLLYYPPTWSETSLHRAGLIEPVPPRIAFGRYALWDDLQRTAAVLAARARVQAALTAEVQATAGPLFTDMPGIAAQAGVVARLQVFEQRQLLDQGEWDQQPLLRELANGELPLGVLEYLGNWLTPEMVTLIAHRYAQDGSLGPFDLYRPVAPGPRTAVDVQVTPGLQLTGFRLAPPGGTAYAPGELLVLTLEWRQTPGAATPADLEVVLQLTAPGGRPLHEDVRPLLYGVLPPANWPAGQSVQHMQPFQLPPALPPRDYELAVTLRAAGHVLAAPQQLTTLSVAADGGRYFDETGYFVPAPLVQAWAAAGATAGAGYPLTPAVPFAWGTLQCFERICLELRDGTVSRRPLGERLYLAETIRAAPCTTAAGAATLCPPFAAHADRLTTTAPGTALSGVVLRNGFQVQWTRYTRLERDPLSGAIGLGRLGDDSLRLPPGVRYRWP